MDHLRIPDGGGETGSRFLNDPAQVARALLRYEDVFDPRTTSLMTVGRTRTGVDAEPFHSGFISGFEERAELRRRMHHLAPRDRQLLYLWYVASWPVTQIAKTIGVSRVHCYRLRKRALWALSEADGNGNGNGNGDR